MSHEQELILGGYRAMGILSSQMIYTQVLTIYSSFYNKCSKWLPAILIHILTQFPVECVMAEMVYEHGHNKLITSLDSNTARNTKDFSSWE
jgi:hypothetical protein